MQAALRSAEFKDSVGKLVNVLAGNEFFKTGQADINSVRLSSTPNDASKGKDGPDPFELS
jgi:hypothetical protein